MSKSNWVALLVAALELPSHPAERKLWGRLAILQLVYSLSGLILGLVCIIGGIVLFLHGVTGSSSWVAQVIGLQTKLSDAAPGTVLFVAGVVVVYCTRFEIRVREQPAHEVERPQHVDEIAVRRRKAS